MTSDSRAPLAVRIRERADAAGITLPSDMAAQLAAFYELLFRWNRTINLTSLADSPAAIDRLLLEPVAAAPHLPRGGRLMDIGSGGGSPAIPLALSIASDHTVMVESRVRKAAFLREALRELALPGEVFEGRLESLDPATQGPIRVVSARAVHLGAGHLEKIAALLGRDGVVALFRGPSSSELDLGAGKLRRIGSHPLSVSPSSTLELLGCSTWNKES